MSKRKSYGAVLIQSFGGYEGASAAVMSLIEAGFKADEISVVLADSVAGVRVPVARGGGSGLAERGQSEGPARILLEALGDGGELAVPGAGVVLAGPLVSVLGRPGGGSLSHALRQLGLEKEEAEHYRKRAEAGDIVVVAAAGRR